MRRVLAVFSFLFMLPFCARAAGPTYISEIAWAGSSASLADEWLELCGGSGTDLSGWSIEGASASPVTLAEGSVIPDSGAYLIANYSADDAKSTLAYAPDLVTTSVSLSNSDLFIILRDATGAVVDMVGAEGSAPSAGTSGDAKASMERVDPALDGSDPAAWMTAVVSLGFDTDANEAGSPGSCPVLAAAQEEAPAETTVSSTATEPVAPQSRATPEEPMSAVRISEIYPSPNAGEDEWVELVNPSNVGEFLDGWTIEDASGTKTKLGGLLMPWARYVIGSPKGSLNNDGDAVILKDALTRVVDRVDYPKTKKGEAYMRVELREEFRMTLTPTRGGTNVFTTTEIPAETETAAVTAVPAPLPASPTSVPAVAQSPTAVSTVKLPVVAPNAAPKSAATKAAPAKATVPAKPAPHSRYKGDAYAATIVVPPGVYAKTRAYVQRGDVIEELRFSTSPGAAWSVGDRVTFVAQKKSEGAVTFLLANPNSVRVTGSASATFAVAESWPSGAGGYRFTAEVASVHGNAIEVKLGGVEGDVLAPSGTGSALKPGDAIQVEGFIAPGPRPQVVLPYDHALRLFKAYAPEEPTAGRAKMPAWMTVALTLVVAIAGLLAYLRAQRLKRIALTAAPMDAEAWE